MKPTPARPDVQSQALSAATCSTLIIFTSLSSSTTDSASRNAHLAACSVSLQLRAEQFSSGPHRQLSCAGVLVVCSNRAPVSQAQAYWVWGQAEGSTAALLWI